MKNTIEFEFKNAEWVSSLGRGRSISEIRRKISAAGFEGTMALSARVKRHSSGLLAKRERARKAMREYVRAEYRAVVALRRDGMGLRDVAALLGLSRERIRQIESGQ